MALPRRLAGAWTRNSATLADALAGQPPLAVLLAVLRDLAGRGTLALEEEWALRRPFLWPPAATGAGALFYLLAATEPVLWLVAAFSLFCSCIAWRLRARRGFCAALVGLAALGAGECLGARGARRRAGA